MTGRQVVGLLSGNRQVSQKHPEPITDTHFLDLNPIVG